MIRFVKISLMKALFSVYRSQIQLLFLALIWVAFVVFVFRPDKQALLFGDSKSYYFAAVDLYQKGHFNDHRPMVIAALNGFPLLFGFPSASIFIWSHIVNLSCWLATIFLLFGMARQLVGDRWAFWISVGFMLSVGNLFVAFHLLSESVFTFCLTFIFYLVWKHTQTQKIQFLIFTLTLCLLAILIKPMALLLFALLLVFFYSKGWELLKSWYSMTIYLAVFALCVQLYAMKKTYGDCTLSYIDAFTYYNYLGTRADCLRNNTKFIQGENARYAYFSMLTPSQQKATAAEDFTDQLKSNPVNLLKAYVINLQTNISDGSAAVHGCTNVDNTGYFEILHWLFKAMAKLQNILLTFAGLITSGYALLKWRKTQLLFKVIAMVVFYVFLISAISSNQGDRFHLVLYPMVWLLSAGFLSKRILND